MSIRGSPRWPRWSRSTCEDRAGGSPLSAGGARKTCGRTPPEGVRPPAVRTRRWCEVSALVVSRRRRLVGQPAGLILYIGCDLLQLRLELPAVVSAEEQLSTAGEYDAQVSLSAATVAAVCRCQRTRGGQNSGHVASSLARRAVVPGSTSNQAENVPAHGFSSETVVGMTGCYRLAANRSQLRQMSRLGLVVRTRPRLAVGLLLRTCPEPKWFMPLWERDMCITRAGYRTPAR